MTPKKSQEPQTNEEKYKSQLQAENDLGSYSRQYSLLERDRSQLVGGCKLARLRNIVNIFRKEHSNILRNLEVASAPCKVKADTKLSDELVELLDQYNVLDMEVKKQKEYLLEINGNIHMTKKEVIKLRQQQTTDRQHEERIWAAIKTVEGLENKLDVQNKKFGTVCASNREKRDTIKSLLWQRGNFLKCWKQMIDKLVLGKRYMMDLIEQATIAYDQREEWCSKLQALRLKAHYDLNHHTHEMQELKRNKDNNAKLESFYLVKGQRRTMRDLQLKEQVRRIELQAKLKQQMESHKIIVSEILDFTRETELTVIVRKYCKREADNFSKFQFVNDLIREMEMLNDELGELHVDIDTQRGLILYREERQAQILEEMTTKLADVASKNLETGTKLKEVDEYLAKMCLGVEQIFQICHCDKDSILQLLADNTTVNIFNVFFYIELIEAKINEALCEVHLAEKKAIEYHKMKSTDRVIRGDTEKPPFYDLSEISPTNPCPLCFEYEFVSDVIDCRQRVLTREQAKKELEERLKTTELSAEKVHNVSACFLPKSRQIVQKRYQE